MKIDRKQGYRLLHEGLIELARVEENGIKIDLPRLAATKLDLERRCRKLTKSLQQDEMWSRWRKRFGSKANLNAKAQLGVILYNDMGYPVKERTKTGQPSMEAEVLQEIDLPFVKDYARFLTYDKALGTFLTGIEREIAPDGRLHPSFNLHLARTFRSSSNDPNFQNFPVRDKEIAQLIRSLFVASPKCVLVENDFKGIEVALSASYHHDPNFIDYITTPGKDMHRDMAAQIYKLKAKDVSKDARYGAKNKFVFPQFYGDYYIACAANMWDWIRKGKLTTPEGLSLFKHLKQQGITHLGALDPKLEPAAGSFEGHLKAVEKDFWNKRFRVYGQWKRSWFQQYLEKGYFDIYTGFRVYGVYDRKQVCNYPIQGAAFHCLLWSLTRINRILRRHHMKSLIVGQIHDSLLGDVQINELRDYLEIVQQVTTVDLVKQYPWLAVPPEIECEICPEGKSWFDKREVKFKDGRFQHPKDPTKSTANTEQFLSALN